MRTPDTFFVIEIDYDGDKYLCGPYKTFLAAAEASLDLVPEMLFINLPSNTTGQVSTLVLECTLTNGKMELINVRGADRQANLIHSGRHRINPTAE